MPPCAPSFLLLLFSLSRAPNGSACAYGYGQLLTRARAPRLDKQNKTGGEGRVPMAQVRAEGDQGQPLPARLLPVLLRAVVPGEEEGAAQRGRQDHPGGHVRGRPQPRPAAAAQRRRQQGRDEVDASGDRGRATGAATAAAAPAAAETRGRDGAVVGGREEEPRRAYGGHPHEGSRVQGGASQRALRPDPRSLPAQGLTNT
jgi:hypothetical protein